MVSMVMRICLVGKKDGNVSDLFFFGPFKTTKKFGWEKFDPNEHNWMILKKNMLVKNNSWFLYQIYINIYFI